MRDNLNPEFSGYGGQLMLGQHSIESFETLAQARKALRIAGTRLGWTVRTHHSGNHQQLIAWDDREPPDAVHHLMMRFAANAMSAALKSPDAHEQDGATAEMPGVDSVSVDADTHPAAVRTDPVRPEVSAVRSAPRTRVGETSIERRESQLSARFERWMTNRGHDIQRFRITVPGEPPLFTDLYDADARVLYEVKGASTRECVRMAVGQLYDYRRHVIPAGPRLAVLLPSLPQDDVRALLGGLDIALVCPLGDGFHGLPD